MTALFVAAGGGGDVLASALLSAAVGGGERPVVATYAWDRLLVDPLPGPRGRELFTGLRQLGDHVFEVVAGSRPVPPAGSTLPRLAAELLVRLVLLDPYGGGRGMARQLAEAVSLFGVDEVTVVDVGGDILARGDEPGLKSPLADALALAACSALDFSVKVAVAGPGLDGELQAGLVRDRLTGMGGAVGVVLSAADLLAAGSVFDWHPSEASAMLAAAVGGARGTVEVRDGGMRIRLDESTAEVWYCPAAALVAAGPLPSSLAGTESLDEVEDVIRKVCGFCEIDYERAKAARLSTGAPPTVSLEVLEGRVADFSEQARGRGVDFVTFRRLAEAIGAGAGGYERLRVHLVQRWPDRAQVPLWNVHASPPSVT